MGGAVWRANSKKLDKECSQHAHARTHTRTHTRVHLRPVPIHTRRHCCMVMGYALCLTYRTPHTTHTLPLRLTTTETTVEGSCCSGCVKLLAWRLAVGYTVNNSSGDLIHRLSGFYLPRRQWSLLHRFRTGEGHCGMCWEKWGLTDNEMWDCSDIQTSHIVNSCSLASEWVSSV